MAGKPGRSGGARPGAGRKRAATADAQQSRRDIVLDVVDEPTWREHVEGLVAQTRRGNYAALLPLYPFLLGSPKQQHEHTGPDGGPFRIVIERVESRGRDQS